MTGPNISSASPSLNTETARFQASIKETQEADAASDNAISSGGQEASKEDLEAMLKANTLGGAIKNQRLVKPPEIKKTEKAKEAQESVLVSKEEADSLADGFNRREGNRDYNLDPRRLSALAQLIGSEINEDTNTDSIIEAIRRSLAEEGKEPDPALIDKTLEFLVEVARTKVTTAKGDKKNILQKILNQLESAKTNYFTNYKDQIETSQRIMPAVAAMSQVSAQDHGDTLAYYKNAIYNPQDIHAIQKQYEKIGEAAMKAQIKTFIHLIGKDLKNTRMEVAEMVNLNIEVRKMQAFLGVTRETRKQLALLNRLLEQNQFFEVNT